MRLAPFILLLGTTLGAAMAPSAAWSQARIFCCEDAKGRKVCGDFLPKECAKRAYEERDDKGFVVNRKEAPLTPAQMAQREAELVKKEEETKRKTEERRRNLALLSTYSEERDIDSARERAIDELQKQVAQAEKQVETAVKNRTKAEKEKEFYKNKPLPAPVKKQIDDAEAELKVKQDILKTRKAEIDKTRTKFEEEKKKFRELKGIVSPGPSAVVPLVPEAPAAPAPATPPGAPASAAAPAAPAAPSAPTPPTAPTPPAAR